MQVKIQISVCQLSPCVLSQYSGTLVRVSAECFWLFEGYVADALGLLEAKKRADKQQAVLFAVVADAVSLLLTSHFQTVYFGERT